jgi:hypothetical protein
MWFVRVFMMVAVSSLSSFAAILLLGAFAVVLGLFKLRESLFVIRQT